MSDPNIHRLERKVQQLEQLKHATEIRMIRVADREKSQQAAEERFRAAFQEVKHKLATAKPAKQSPALAGFEQKQQVQKLVHATKQAQSTNSELGRLAKIVAGHKQSAATLKAKIAHLNKAIEKSRMEKLSREEEHALEQCVEQALAHSEKKKEHRDMGGMADLDEGAAADAGQFPTSTIAVLPQPSFSQSGGDDQKGGTQSGSGEGSSGTPSDLGSNQKISQLERWEDSSGAGVTFDYETQDGQKLGLAIERSSFGQVTVRLGAENERERRRLWGERALIRAALERAGIAVRSVVWG